MWSHFENDNAILKHINVNAHVMVLLCVKEIKFLLFGNLPISNVTGLFIMALFLFNLELNTSTELKGEIKCNILNCV